VKYYHIGDTFSLLKGQRKGYQKKGLKPLIKRRKKGQTSLTKGGLALIIKGVIMKIGDILTL
jgi:hypothetical protein